MEISPDPYEQKLYYMFKSCDGHCTGFLDEEALRKLCEMLELRDRGSVLIETLVADTTPSRVSFGTFKEALLNFLGTEFDGSVSSTTASCNVGKLLREIAIL